jgi:hypothetical protein
LVYFVVIWYIVSVLVYCPNKNLATLDCSQASRPYMLEEEEEKGV